MALFLVLATASFIGALVVSLATAKQPGGLAAEQLWNSLLVGLVIGLVVWLFVLDGQTGLPEGSPPSTTASSEDSVPATPEGPRSDWWAAP